MQRHISPLSAVTSLLISLIMFSCSKLDTTDIGSDTIPEVDNVKTFADTLSITSSQGIFNPDTTIVFSIDNHVLGKINNDPLFGTTTANIFLQLKPSFYPYFFGNPKDTIDNTLAPGTGFDSVVLCLSYKGFWGDSTIPLQLEVREIVNNPGNNGLWDSTRQIRNINYTPTTGNIIGNATIDPLRLRDEIKYANGRDFSKNTIRIKLSAAFANTFFARDTLSSGGNGSFRTDSLFKLFNNGFAILATGSGNGLMYCNLTDTSTKLEVHYRKKNGGKIDTAYSSFKLSNGTITPISATANNIIRNRSGFPVSSPSPDEIYLQATPGTYANLTIPDLSGLSNRIVHRAEIIIEQIPTDPILDGTLSAPDFLYLDLKDTGATNTWKPIYYDLNPNINYDPDNKSIAFPVDNFGRHVIDFSYYGGYKKEKTDKFGNTIKYYNFNITRYVQQIVTNHKHNYSLRLYAPFQLRYPQLNAGTLAYNNSIAFGRVKVGSGTNPDYKMVLRIVYSKI